MGAEIQPSREVRMAGGITQGFAERVALSIYGGSSDELIKGITSIELTIELQKSKAARELAQLLKMHLRQSGYATIEDVDRVLEDYLENTTLDQLSASINESQNPPL